MPDNEESLSGDEDLGDIGDGDEDESNLALGEADEEDQRTSICEDEEDGQEQSASAYGRLNNGDDEDFEQIDDLEYI